MMTHTKLRPRFIALPIAVAVLMLAGCGAIPWLANGIGGGAKTVDVKARYPHLDHQRVAVLVAVDSQTLFHHPQAPVSIGRAVSAAIVEHVPGVRVMNPTEIAAYTAKHPYWTTVPYGQLLDQLHVSRVVLVDVVDYRMHEPGNKYVWNGRLSGNVSVYAGDAADPDNAVFATQVQARFPSDTKIGAVNTNDRTVALGLVSDFATKTGYLFYDHQETRQ